MIESITLSDIWGIIKKAWIIVVVAALIGGLLAALYTVAFVPKKYTSSVTLYVCNVANSTTGNVNTNDLNASQLLANTSVQLLMKEPARKLICDRLSVELTPGQLGGFVSIKQTVDTELLTVSATTTDPVLSAEICNAYAAVAPEYLQGIIEAGSFKAIDEAHPAASPSSPSLSTNAVVGAILGGIVCFFVFFIIFLFDNSVKDAEDIKNRFGLPVLGEVPSFVASSK